MFVSIVYSEERINFEFILWYLEICRAFPPDEKLPPNDTHIISL